MSKPAKNKKNHKNIKNLPRTQKLKLKSLISIKDLIQKRFQDVITCLQDKTELTAQDRYSLGYSLLKTQQLPQALMLFWPLIAHHPESPLQEDCAIICHYIFKNEPQLLEEPFSDTELYTLFLIAKRFASETAAFQTLKKRLLTALFEHKEYAKLETVLKLTQDKYSLAYTENSGKLFFLQAETKSTGNIFTFIGRVLTGGGALILQTLLYHDAIAPAIHALAHELKQRLFNLPEKQVEKFGDKTCLEQFIDDEADILITLLQTSLSFPLVPQSVLPTPSVFFMYDENDATLRHSFLPWLKKHCPGFFNFYEVKTQKTPRSITGSMNTNTSSSSLNVIKRPLLEQENPFTLLDIDVTESKPAVMQKVMKLIQAYPNKMATIRQAQNEIFNPAQRFLHHYGRFINDDFKSVVIDSMSQSSHEKIDIDKISLREALCHV